MEKPKYPFEDFLDAKFWENYHGTDDDSPDAFEHWLVNLQVDDLIAYANQFGNMILNINKK